MARTDLHISETSILEHTQPSALRNPPDTGDIIDLLGLLAALRRHVWLILGVVVAGLVIAVLIIMVSHARFVGTTLVIVDPQRTALEGPAVISAAEQSARVDSEVELVVSDEVLAKVVVDLDLLDELGAPPPEGVRDWIYRQLGLAGTRQNLSGEQNAIIRLREDISVQRVGLTDLIAITAQTDSAEGAASLANAIAATYVSEQRISKTIGVTNQISVARSQIRQAQAQLTDDSHALEQIVSDNLDLIFTAADTPRVGDLLKQIEALKQANDPASPSGATGGAPADGDPAMPDNERVEVRVQLADLRAQLRSAVFNSGLPAAVLENLSFALDRAAQTQRTHYEALLMRLADLEAQATVQAPDSRVVAQALPQRIAVSPNLPLTLAAGLILSLGIGAGLALLVDRFFGVVWDADQLASLPGVQSVVVLPSEVSRLAKVHIEGTGATLLKPTVANAVGHLFVQIERGLLAAGVPRSAGEGGLLGVIHPSGDKSPAFGRLAASVLELAGKPSRLIETAEAIAEDPAGSTSLVPQAMGKRLREIAMQYEVVVLDGPDVVALRSYIFRELDLFVVLVRRRKTAVRDVQLALTRINELRRRKAGIVAVLHG